MEISAKFVRAAKKVCKNHLISLFLIIAAAVTSASPAALAADLGLIDAAVLKGNLSHWVILDARPRADWENGHIPGAISLYWESYTRTDAKGIQFTSLPPNELAAALAGMGISETSSVVVYGDADRSWGGEGYDVWLLSWLGHKGPIRLLNGGIQAWRNQKLPLTKGPEKSLARKTRYQVSLKPQYIVSTEDIQKGKGTYFLVDVRSTFEWLKGRIPGAVHIPWEDFHTGKDRHPLPAAELKRLLAKHGVDASRPVVFYCLGGVRSAYAWMASQLAGLPDGRNYKGSWAAWEKREGR